MRRRFFKTATSLLLTITTNFFVTSCSAERVASSTKTDSALVQESVVGTGEQLIMINSDNVTAAGYDDSSQVMTVQFDNGYVYEYFGVQPELWTSFIAAQPNPWSQVGYPRLVQGGIAYRRVR